MEGCLIQLLRLLGTSMGVCVFLGLLETRPGHGSGCIPYLDMFSWQRCRYFGVVSRNIYVTDLLTLGVVPRHIYVTD